MSDNWMTLERDAWECCSACGELLNPSEKHQCDLSSADAAALLSQLLLPTLRDAAWLASCAFKLATGYGDVAWLSFDADLDLVRSDLGTMRLSDFRMYYNEGAIG